jgi:hypothetical protein
MYYIDGPRYHLTLSTTGIFILVLLLVWEIIWKGTALWKAGRNRQLAWFIILLIVQSLGILEILYLVYFQTPASTSTRAKNPRV